MFLTGHIDVPDDKLARVKEALVTHIALTRSEPGCISFEVVEDQSCPGRFLVSEAFENHKAFQAHQQRTKNSDWFTMTQGMPRDYSVTTGGADNDIA